MVTVSFFASTEEDSRERSSLLLPPVASSLRPAHGRIETDAFLVLELLILRSRSTFLGSLPLSHMEPKNGSATMKQQRAVPFVLLKPT